MDERAIERARERLRVARDGSVASDAALERAASQLTELAETAARLKTSLPEDVGTAIRDGMRAEALPVARQLAEVRGLAGQVLGRLERLECELLAERHARVDDLALLVDLIASGWAAADARLERIERHVAPPGRSPVYRLAESRPAS